MKKRNLLIAGATGIVLTAGSVTFGATALAAPAAPAVIKACVTDKDGTMRQVSAKTTKCARGQHLVTWNQTGVQGAPGKAGANGVAGLNGTKITSGVGLPSAAIIKASKKGDLYINLTPGKVTVAVFDGVKYGTPVSLQGAAGLQGPKGDTGAQGTPGAPGAPGAPGTPGQDGTQIRSGTGLADEAIVKDSKAGDFYIDLTPGKVTVAVFDGTEYGAPVPLQGAAGEDGEDGVNGTQIRSGTGSASEAVMAVSKKGDLYIDLTIGKVTLAVFDGTEYGAPTPLQGEKGEMGKSTTVKRETVADPTHDAVEFTLTVSCAANETAIGAGYSDIEAGAQLVGSDAGDAATDWVLTFSADPGAAATGTALCAATV